MAFTLHIKSKGLFKSKKIDFIAILTNCGFKFGSLNEFYVLKEEKSEKDTAILYNPKRIGRGIFFDASKASEGEITISYNIPTTAAEIRDFVSLAKEIESQLKKASFYCEEEKKEYTIKSLEENIDNMIAFSLESLHSFCKKEYQEYVLTLALFPWFMPPQKKEQYLSCATLFDLEQTLHDLQKADVYYANPTLMKNKATQKIAAIYTLTEDCQSIFPINAAGFLNLSEVQIDEGLIRFFIYSEKRMVDGVFPYSEFVNYMMKEKGAKLFDTQHMIVPNVSKKEIEEMIEAISAK